MHYIATLTPSQTVKGRYDVTFADLPGCTASGANLEDAIASATEALSGHLEAMMNEGEELPAPSTYEECHKIDLSYLDKGEDEPEGVIYQYIVADIQKKKKAVPPVRINISVRQNLLERIDTVAKDLGISRSALIALACRDYCAKWENED